MKQEILRALATTVVIASFVHWRQRADRTSRSAAVWIVLSKCLSSRFYLEYVWVLLLIFNLSLRASLIRRSAYLKSQIAKCLVRLDSGGVVRGLVDHLLWSIPQTLAASATTVLSGWLAQKMRENLQRWLQSRATEKQWRVDDRLDNVEHRMTNDTLMFCFQSVDILASAVGPFLELATLGPALLHSHRGIPLLIAAYFAATAFVLRKLSPDFTTLQTKLQEREGDFRRVHAQIVSHAEEVSFFRGEASERENCNRHIESLCKRTLTFRSLRAKADFLDSVFAKYGATALGYTVCAIAVMSTGTNINASELTARYVYHQQLFLPFSQAAGKLLRVRSKVALLLSSARRVGELVRDLEASHPVPCDEVKGIPSNTVLLKDIAITAPDGRPLLQHLNLQLCPGEHLLIHGSNGVGKTCLTALLSGVSLPSSGNVCLPTRAILVSPQRTFLPAVSFRELLTYPDTTLESFSKGCGDENMFAICRQLGLEDIFTRIGGWEVTRPWEDELSGGERQRVALARLLYHRPSFAVIDESTNAISQDDEVSLLQLLQREGITLITISHRRSLEVLHNRILNLDSFRCPST